MADEALAFVFADFVDGEHRDDRATPQHALRAGSVQAFACRSKSLAEKPFRTTASSGNSAAAGWVWCTPAKTLRSAGKLR